jgi:hypothetical protein
MGFNKRKKDWRPRDERGHSIRVYDEIFDSHAWAALSPPDVLAYLALLRVLKGSNNGDLSLTLVRAKECGIGHHVTLARALRALCAVGLVAITRKGGCDRGGHREPTLYRVTDVNSSEYPDKCVEAFGASNEWRQVRSAEHGRALIQAAEDAVKRTSKTKSTGHAVTATVSPGVLVGPKTRTRTDPWSQRPGHLVTMAGNAEKPAMAGPVARFSMNTENPSHRSPTRPPLHTATPSAKRTCIEGHGSYQRLRAKQGRLFTRLIGEQQLAA